MDPMADASTVERMLLNQARMKNIPMNGSIELLPLCNLNCKMCYVRLSREEMETQGRIRTVDEWIAVAKEMKHGFFLPHFFVWLFAFDFVVLLPDSSALAQRGPLSSEPVFLRLGRADLRDPDGNFDHLGIFLRILD